MISVTLVAPTLVAVTLVATLAATGGGISSQRMDKSSNKSIDSTT